MGGVYAEAMTSLRPVPPAPGDAGRSAVDRAVGLLAGRAGCRVAEAHRHLLRIAADRHEDVAQVAATVLRMLDTAEALADRGLLDLLPRPLAVPTGSEPTGSEPTGSEPTGSEPTGREPGGAPPTVTGPGGAAPADAATVLRIRRAEPGDTDRVAGTERLGNLGWGEWDLVSGEVYWSRQLYRIYQRDPQLGPLSLAESRALALAEDEPLREAALAAFHRGETVDMTTRIRLGGRTRYLRTVADAVRDGAGRPLRIYGIVQDVTDQENAARRLADVERQLDEQRRSFAAEHALAARLQRIILPLPDGPIALPGLQAAVRYLPASRESLVGGDWYHAAELRDGTVLLAVGDVAGHGTPAATTMAQLRHALRALSVTTGDPGVLLGHLNRLTADLERETPELSATAVIARFDPRLGELVWAQAGHPPPLLCRAGRTAPLGRPPGPMLGVLDDVVYPTARLDLRDGDLLLLYTDGLVEHRRHGLADGLATVIAAVDDAVRGAPRQPLDRVLGRLHRANPDDDTCILAVRASAGDRRGP